MRNMLDIQTHARTQFLDITAQVEAVVAGSGVQEGAAHIFVPHTTAAVTVNENADPTVVADVLSILERLVPPSALYRHSEGNSDAHAKASLLGCSQWVPVTAGRLDLGTWQGVYFCEFDGPRLRRLLVTVIGQ